MNSSLDPKTKDQIMAFERQLEESAKLYQEAAIRLAIDRMHREVYGTHETGNTTAPKKRNNFGVRLGRWFAQRMFPEMVEDGKIKAASPRSPVVIDVIVTDLDKNEQECVEDTNYGK